MLVFQAVGRPAPESGDSGVLIAPLSGGEGEEVGVDGLRGEVACDSQCDAEEWHPAAGGYQSAGYIFIAVADPDSSRSLVIPS